MKIRQGFVSNSSTSSFVVAYRKYNWKDKKQVCLLTKNQLKKLKKNGFKYSNVRNPYFVDTHIGISTENIKRFGKHDDVYLTYDITCNQDDVIYSLLNHKIPFVALCHYDQELVFWDGRSEYFYETTNDVEQAVRFNAGHTDENTFNHTTQKYKIDKWLENERKWVSSSLM